MSGPNTPLRVSVHTRWTRCGFTGSTARAGSDWLFVVTSFTLTFAEKLKPPSVDLEKNTSLFPFLESVQAMQIAFAESSARAGSDWDAPPASLFTRIGTDHVRPSEDFVKKMSDCVTLPPQPVKARYATRSEPTAREGSAAQYAGGPSTIVAGPKYGAAGGAPPRAPRGGIPATASRGRNTPPLHPPPRRRLDGRARPKL